MSRMFSAFIRDGKQFGVQVGRGKVVHATLDGGRTTVACGKNAGLNRGQVSAVYAQEITCKACLKVQAAELAEAHTEALEMDSVMPVKGVEVGATVIVVNEGEHNGMTGEVTHVNNTAGVAAVRFPGAPRPLRFVIGQLRPAPDSPAEPVLAPQSVLNAALVGAFLPLPQPVKDEVYRMHHDVAPVRPRPAQTAPEPRRAEPGDPDIQVGIAALSRQLGGLLTGLI